MHIHLYVDKWDLHNIRPVLDTKYTRKYKILFRKWSELPNKSHLTFLTPFLAIPFSSSEEEVYPIDSVVLFCDCKSFYQKPNVWGKNGLFVVRDKEGNIHTLGSQEFCEGWANSAEFFSSVKFEVSPAPDAILNVENLQDSDFISKTDSYASLKDI